MVLAITSELQFVECMKKGGSIVIDFYSDHCPPCRIIAPKYLEFSKKYQNVTFLKVNVDNCRTLAMRYAIKAIPTFVFVKLNKEIDRLQGGNTQALEAKIRALSQSTIDKPGFVISTAATNEERNFLSQFANSAKRMKLYEDEIAQALASSLLPEDHFRKEAKVADGVYDEIALVRQLCDWFKQDFFKWSDSPKCHKCQEPTRLNAFVNGAPTRDEGEDGALTVEIYECRRCQVDVRFPRYNNPIKLLSTRNGRNLEWTNAFTLFLRALNLDARYVVDVDSNSWCEFYSSIEKRWIHVDPCEGIMDTPLLYEKGFNKKLSYVIANHRDHIRDVTWRYTFDWNKVKERRCKVRESVLENFVDKYNLRFDSTMTVQRKAELRSQAAKECNEFKNPVNNLRKGNPHQGARVSGNEECKSKQGESSKKTDDSTKTCNINDPNCNGTNSTTDAKPAEPEKEWVVL
uniref:Thioredoxin domain-containing protein n=1 Tax=Rhabditophanes sp. KR3021 TaxID=114890 RepID=A0AC35U300_9BILA